MGRVKFIVLFVCYGVCEEFFLKLEKHADNLITKEALRNELLKEMTSVAMDD